MGGLDPLGFDPQGMLKKNKISCCLQHSRRSLNFKLAMQTTFSSVLITLKTLLQYRIIIQFDIS